MDSRSKKGATAISGFLKWLAIPLVIIIAGIFILVGGVQSIGFFGTTPLRGVTSTSPEWNGFQSFLGGAPYSWTHSPTIENGFVKFDRRLIRTFEYIADQKNHTNCGWTGKHETIKLNMYSEPESDLTYSGNPPISTVYRGVGVRIEGADKVKCSILYPDDPIWYKFYEYNISFDIRDVIQPQPTPLGSIVMCALDYYPNLIPPEVIPMVNSTLATHFPAIYSQFPYEMISEKAKEGAVFKTSLLIYEAMSADKRNCEKPDGNPVNDSIVPYQIIIPEWIMKKMGNAWPELRDYHKESFPLSTQKQSDYTGLTFDTKLNEKGIHLNY